MRKILQITSSLDRNGTETFIMNVYRHIDKSRFQFDFLLFTQSTDGFYAEAESLGAKIYRLPTRRNGLAYYVNLFDFFKTHSAEYDCIHFCSCSLTTIFPIICSWLFQVPIRIVHAHNSSWSGIHNYVFHQINRLIIPFIATDFLACSKKAAKWFYPFMLRKKWSMIKNGIDVTKFAYDTEARDKVRKELGLENAFVIGNVGRFVKEKNHIFLLQLLQKTLLRVPTAKLVLVGDGELYANVKEQAKKMKIDSNVLFLGRRCDVERVLQAFDCFVLPSLFEGLPFVLLEAQCSGLKVLVSDAVTIEAKVTDNIRFLNLNQDISVWVDDISQFTRYARKDESENLAKEGYSINDTVMKMTEIYMR